MSDELMEELNQLLNKTDNKSNKLQSYFSDDTEKDDLFAYIAYDNKLTSNLGDSIKTDLIDISSSLNTNEKDNIKSQTFFDKIEMENLDNHIGIAWLKSENTKNILVNIMSRDISINQVNKSILARPQLYSDPNQKLIDPLFSLLSDNYNYDTAVELRQVPSIDDYQLTEKDVLSLIENGWLRPAIDLTAKILNKIGFTFSKSTPIESTTTNFTIESGRIWCLRFTLLIRLKFFSILESELSGFLNLDCPNLYKEFYSDINSISKKGSLIPFSMRIIHAELPLYFNKFSDALNRLYYLLAVIKRILINLESGYSEDGMNLLIDDDGKNQAIKVWRKRKIRIMISCMRVLIISKDYPSVVSIIRNLLNESSTTDSIGCMYSPGNLYRLLGRVYLQLGDVENAVSCFETAIKTNNSDNAETVDNNIKVQTSFQNALINISRGNYEEAKRCLQICLEINPKSYQIIAKINKLEMEHLENLESEINQTDCLTDGHCLVDAVVNENYHDFSAIVCSAKGLICLALDDNNNKVFLKSFIKIYENNTFLKDPETGNFIPYEYYYLKLLSNQSFVPKLLNYHDGENWSTVVMEFLDQDWTDLFYFIDEDNEEKVYKYILENILLSLYRMSQLGFYHGDIKPENIMVNRKSLEIKLIDFEDIIYDESEYPESSYNCGTIGYKSPETFFNESYEIKPSLVFNIGCLLYSCIERHAPFNSQDDTYCCNSLEMHYCSPSAQLFIEQSVKLLPEDRIQFDDLINHRWFTDL